MMYAQDVDKTIPFGFEIDGKLTFLPSFQLPLVLNSPEDGEKFKNLLVDKIMEAFNFYNNQGHTPINPQFPAE